MRIDRLKNNKDFIDWLKKHKCSGEMINDILSFDDQIFNVFKNRVKEQPELLTAIVENGYDSDVIHKIFCSEEHKIYNNFLQYKEFIILLLIILIVKVCLDTVITTTCVKLRKK